MLNKACTSILFIDGVGNPTCQHVPALLAEGSLCNAVVTRVENVCQALAAISADPDLDVVLLTLGAGENGLDELDRLRAGCQDHPIIVLGGPEDPVLASGAMERGVADYIPRAHLQGPLLDRAVSYAIERIADHRRMQEALGATIEQLERTNNVLARRERELMTALDDVRHSHEALETTQLQLLQVEKMESVGRLAAGIAHEVKNPLAIISTGIDFLNQSAAAGDASIGRALASMSRAVRRADSVVRGLLDFSAPAPLTAEPCDLNSVIRQALVLVDHELMRCKIALHVDLHESLPMVSVDANKIEQVFLNLFINAIQAMPEGGELTLRTRAEQLAALGHNVGDHRAERFRAGEVVVVAEVDDTGHGIAEDKLPKVFDPFFTTKPTGKGTGLGLSVARTIIELHGGMLQLANRPERGVRALLVLKATGETSHDHDQSFQDPSADRGRRAGFHAHDGHGATADRAV